MASTVSSGSVPPVARPISTAAAPDAVDDERSQRILEVATLALLLPLLLA